MQIPSDTGFLQEAVFLIILLKTTSASGQSGKEQIA